MKLNSYSPVNSASSTSGHLRFSAFNTSHTDPAKIFGGGCDSFSFTFKVPGSEEKYQLEAFKNSRQFKAYQKDVHAFEEKTQQFHWQDPEDENEAFVKILEDHDAVIQELERLEAAVKAQKQG